MIAPAVPDGEIGRLTVWQDEAAANHAANDPHAMALHAQVQFATVSDLWDRSFATDETATLRSH